MRNQYKKLVCQNLEALISLQLLQRKKEEIWDQSRIKSILRVLKPSSKKNSSKWVELVTLILRICKTKLMAQFTEVMIPD
jgi:hypothetical protein